MRQKVYTHAVSDQEDYNEFNSWDCAGSALMLAFVPAVIYFVFNDHDLVGTLMLSAMAAGVGVVVFFVAHFTNSRIVSRIMQLIGTVLCVLYWIYAMHKWMTTNRFEGIMPGEEPAAASPQSAPTVD